ncbi:MAG: ATP-binding protein [Muribaculaceae bacterium]|nr:ATP-binding protein [Muribaculaceae bacterium]
MTKEVLRIVREITMVLGGDVILKDEGVGQKELRYVRKVDGLNVSIDEVATGMKSFAYLLRLLQNGYIDSETLLIIDEPEAHLHPQWIVKFAKVLVLIQKLLGAKIMVASHDPDMVAAINAMAEAEGLSDVTNFYQAAKESGELRYIYVNSGNDISRIFESFNIALDRIDGYTATDLS